MERALAAFHQACPAGAAVSLHYAAVDGRVGLFIDCANRLEPLLCQPVAANYPDGALTPVDGFDPLPPSWSTWTMELHLSPEILPILRHGQFEDMLNHNFADPITTILKGVSPSDEVRCSVEMRIAPASRRRKRRARQTLRLLDRAFFRRH
jgi:hypothetical protein